MKLGFGEIERALQGLHEVAPSRGAAFRARLRYLQQKVDIGLPRGGTGRRANFTFGHAVLFALALDLEQFGMPPERIQLLFGTVGMDVEVTTLREAFYEVASRIGTDKGPTLLWFVPEALSDSTRDPIFDTSAHTVEWGECIPQNYLAAGSTRSRLAIINLSVLVSSLMEQLGGEPDAYVSALIAWANGEEAN